MCTMSVLCPLCTQASFSSIDALRASLIKAANGPLPCPICHESFLGLDKLTIHLFSHTNLMSNVQAATSLTTSLPLSPPSTRPIISAITATATATTTTPPPPAPPATTTTVATQLRAISPPTTTPTTAKTKTKCTTCEANGLALPITDGTKVLATAPTQAAAPSSAFMAMSATATKKITTQEAACRERCSKKSKPAQPYRVNALATATTTTPATETAATKGTPCGSPTQALQQQQQPQSVNTASQPCIRSYGALATCDVCELTFRSEQLRDMHFRLVHQNRNTFAPIEVNALSIDSSGSGNMGVPMLKSFAEHEFKCHLCAKTFKMKGSLRVHLKVVHLVPHESRQRATDAGGTNAAAPMLMGTTPLPSQAAAAAPQALAANVMPPAGTTFSIGTLTLLPGANGAVASIGATGDGVLNINASDGTNSNLLLVFNAANMAAAPTALAQLPFKQEIVGAATGGPGGPAAAAGSYTDTNPKIWECDVCTKAFTTKYFLKKHKRLHTGEMPYTCEVCGRTFTFQQSYHKHLLYHNDEKPHVCSTCGRAFKELSTLHNHERIHSGEKPFKCEVCGKSFRQRVSFLVHTRIHTGVMPYKCEYCQKSFRYKVSQRTHKCATRPTSDANDPQAPDAADAEAAMATATATAADQMSDSFFKAFLESNAITQMCSSAQQSPASHEIANITASQIDEHEEALLLKSIDDIVVESCNKMGIANTIGLRQQHHQQQHQKHQQHRQHQHHHQHQQQQPQHQHNGYAPDGSNSPSEQLQNMRLYSPQQLMADMAATIEGGNSGGDGGDGGGGSNSNNDFPNFLLDDVNSNML